MGVVMGTSISGQDMFIDLIKSGVTAGQDRGRPSGRDRRSAQHAGFPHQQRLLPAFRGPLNTVVTACAAGTQAIGVGVEEIRRGAVDVMLVGGVEAMISEVFFATFEAMRRGHHPERQATDTPAGPLTRHAMAL